MAFVLQLHNIWRWVLLVAAIVVVIKALVGWLGKRPFTKLDDQLGMAFVTIVDIQVFARPDHLALRAVGSADPEPVDGQRGFALHRARTPDPDADRPGLRTHRTGAQQEGG